MIAPNDGGGSPPKLKQSAFRFHTDLNLVDLITHGFWDCKACGKILLEGPNMEGELSRCPLCNSPRVKYHEPLPKDG